MPPNARRLRWSPPLPPPPPITLTLTLYHLSYVLCPIHLYALYPAFDLRATPCTLRFTYVLCPAHLYALHPARVLRALP